MAITTDVAFWVDLVNGSDTDIGALTSCTVSNPSGTIARVSKTGHGLQTGAVVDGTVWGNAYYNSQWAVTYVDANSFDLVSAVYVASTGGTITPRGGTINTPWKTLTTGATAARLANLTNVNFDVRTGKTADPISLSTNVTLTNGSLTGTLASARTRTLDNCEVAWTGATNVTMVTNSTRKQGTVSNYATCGAAFTTGEVCYKDLGSTIDLSMYTGICISLQRANAGTISAGQVQVRMYSDVGRTTLVETFNLTGIANYSRWMPMYVDKGSALSSTVRAISIYANTTMVSTNIMFDNVIACTSAFHLRSLIGINDGLWMSVDWIDGTTFGVSNNSQASTPTVGYGWPKDTITSTAYTRDTFVHTEGGLAATSTIALQANLGGGSQTARGKYSFGWNLSNQTQDGETWIDGLYGLGYLLNIATTLKYVTIDRLCASRMGILLALVSSNQDIIVSNCKSIAHGAVSYGMIVSNPTSCFNVEFDHCISFGGVYGFSFSISAGLNIHDCESYNQTSCGWYITQCECVRLKNCVSRGHSTGGATAITVSSSGEVSATSCTFKDCANIGVRTDTSSKFVLLSCTFSNVINKFKTANSGRIWAVNCTFDNLTTLWGAVTAGDVGSGKLLSNNTNNVAGDHRVYHTKGTVLTDNTVYHGSAIFSWKFMPLVLFPTVEIDFPVEIELHKCVCVANVAQTVSVWSRRDNVGLSVGMRIKELNLTGVVTTDALCTAAINTWQQISLTFTPTQNGVITIYGIAYGGTTWSGWLSDLTPMANQSTKLLTIAFGGQPFSSNSGEASITPAFAYIQ